MKIALPSNSIIALLLTILTISWPSGAHAQDTATGTGALQSSAGDNVADGYYALNSGSGVSASVAVGYQSMGYVAAPQDGLSDTSVGAYALENDSGGDNAAFGYSALSFNTGGTSNVAIGQNALTYNTTGSYNEGDGYHVLYENTNGSFNTANGTEALYSNTSGSYNVANGANALLNSNGSYNVADGANALVNSISGVGNLAAGYDTLYSNESGNANVAEGYQSLYFNTSGYYNMGVGFGTLVYNTSGYDNSASGTYSLAYNVTGHDNTASGYHSLYNSTGNQNTAMGTSAGSSITSGSNNIDIGEAVTGTSSDTGVIRIGVQGTQTATYLAGVYGTTISNVPVYVNSNGQLGVMTSSKRFKHNIKDMGDRSDVLLALKPVSYQYNASIDPSNTPQFGLVAEDVAKVDPDLTVTGTDGKPYTVRYEAVNAMLLNEFLKEHQKVGDLTQQISSQQKELDALKAQLGEIVSRQSQAK